MPILKIKPDCYWYDPKFDTHSCKLEEKVGICPCEGCTKYISKSQADEVMREYCTGKSKEPKLKPCPFCGTEVKMLKKALYGYPGSFDFEVRCPKCGCTVNYTHSDTVYRTEEEAIANVTKTWNERYVNWFERAKESEETK